MVKEILTVKRCGVLLIVAFIIYFILDITLHSMKLIPALVSAICTTIAFGLFLYLIRMLSKEKEKEKVDGKKILRYD